MEITHSLSFENKTKKCLIGSKLDPRNKLQGAWRQWLCWCLSFFHRRSRPFYKSVIGDGMFVKTACSSCWKNRLLVLLGFSL